jgi:orotidine-5'-phosphate decarboxylase
MMFSERLQQAIDTTGSVLLAGCDPVLTALPQFLQNDAATEALSDEQYVQYVLDAFVDIFLAGVAGKVAAIKPNSAFFEQFGLCGVRSFSRLCTKAREGGLLIIVDAKRGDIGSTAAAYSNAYLGRASVRGGKMAGFDCDAVTVNPFLGFDTLEPFVKDCVAYGKGIFVLVQTSNPGSKDLQALTCDGITVSERIANWLHDHAKSLTGASGWSGLGAVIGATYPEQAKALRRLMPTNLFLIPGFGAQGAQATEAVAGFGRTPAGKPGGAVVNVSRGLLNGSASTSDEFVALIAANTTELNAQLIAAL